MVNQTTTKITRHGTSHSLYLEKAFVEDSAFPFKPGEAILCMIDGKNVVMMKK